MNNIPILHLILLFFIMMSLLLNIIIIFYRRFIILNTRRTNRLTHKWESFIDEHFVMKEPSKTNIEKYLRKKLKNTLQLISFMEAAKGFMEAEDANLQEPFITFIQENEPLWIILAKHYSKESAMHQAYFAYVCAVLPIKTESKNSELISIMQEYTNVHSVYTKENALNALYNFGYSEPVVKGLLSLSNHKRGLNHKLITDGLLSYKGNHKELIEKLYSNLPYFSLEIQRGVIDYFSFHGESVQNKLYRFLTMPNIDTDITCAILRYYKKYPTPEYKPIILKWASSEYSEDWESVATAISTLSVYPGEDTVSLLFKTIYSKNWYIRKNTAQTLKQLGIERKELTPILEGDDKYAIDQINYSYNLEG